MNRDEMIYNLEHSSSYRMAYQDPDLLRWPEARMLRLQLEYYKPEQALRDHHVHSTVIVFGSARVPAPEDAASVVAEAQSQLDADPQNVELACNLQRKKRLASLSRYYEEVRRFSETISVMSKKYFDSREYVILTGGGPGIMESGNRGAHDAGCRSVGLNIKLPFEQHPNPWITPELCFQFHYFAIRKLHFLLRAKALVAAPGGFGTFDELFEVLTLVQTHRTAKIPIVLLGREFWESAVNFQFLVDNGLISEQDIKLFRFANTADETLAILKEFHGIITV
jgi:Predicted Rossmann fold nucleotide-binding protein